MTSPYQSRSKIFTLFGLACLTIPVSIYVLWLNVIDLGSTQAERVAIFHSYFPEFLHGRWSTTLLSILFCTLSLVFCVMSLKDSQKAWKVLNIIILILSGLLLQLNIFSMM